MEFDEPTEFIIECIDADQIESVLAGCDFTYVDTKVIGQTHRKSFKFSFGDTSVYFDTIGEKTVVNIFEISNVTIQILNDILDNYPECFGEVIHTSISSSWGPEMQNDELQQAVHHHMSCLPFHQRIL